MPNDDLIVESKYTADHHTRFQSKHQNPHQSRRKDCTADSTGVYRLIYVSLGDRDEKAFTSAHVQCSYCPTAIWRGPGLRGSVCCMLRGISLHDSCMDTQRRRIYILTFSRVYSLRVEEHKQDARLQTRQRCDEALMPFPRTDVSARLP